MSLIAEKNVRRSTIRRSLRLEASIILRGSATSNIEGNTSRITEHK